MMKTKNKNKKKKKQKNKQTKKQKNPKRRFFRTLNEDSNQPILPRSLIRVFVFCMKKFLHPWLSKMRTVRILVELHEYAG